LSRRLASNAAKSSQPATGKNIHLSPEIQSWQAAGLHCSANERRADEASRDVEAWVEVSIYARAFGRGFQRNCFSSHRVWCLCHLRCHVCGRAGSYHRTRRGLFPIDEARQELRGERTGIRYAIGARVRVQVSRVDLEGRKIDFRWVQDDVTELQSAGTRKVKGKDGDEKFASLKSQGASPRQQGF
jgi:ribonuclease R